MGKACRDLGEPVVGYHRGATAANMYIQNHGSLHTVIRQNVNAWVVRESGALGGNRNVQTTEDRRAFRRGSLRKKGCCKGARRV